MLTPDYLDTLPDALVALWQQVEEDILRDVARRIGKLGEVTETAAWQLWRFEQVQALHQDVVGTLAKYTGKSDAEIRRLLEQAASDALTADDAIYRSAGKDPAPVNDSPALLNLLNAGYAQTAGEWKNLTATTANTVTRQFEAALDRAWLQVSSGAFDYKTAVRKAVGGLAERMDGVTYPSGRTDTLEVAVRRAVLTGVNQTAGKLQTARMDEMDCEFVETTAHAGARPEHAAWQGKVFHRGGPVTYQGKRYEDFETATGYGTGPGLCGWNCRHGFWPFYPGLSEPNYSAAELAALNEKCIEYNGQKYTKYEISQMQRAAERNVRRWKKRYLAEDAAGLDTTESAVRLKAARQSLAQFVRDTGGRNDSARTGVAGFGRSEASRAAWAAKRAFTNPAQNDMIKPSSQMDVKQDVNFVCRLDREIYKVVTGDIASSEVIITDVQLQHIRERHPDISETVKSYLSEAILQPDYIIETDRPNTANILKRFTIDGKGYQLVLRLKTSNDPAEFKNSIITFMSVNEKRWNQYLRNRKILYKHE